MARYDETESLWLLPVFMRADDFDRAMSEVVDDYGLDVSALTRPYSVWNAIDSMDDAAIDALADELNILWYDKLAPLDAKRSVVRNCKHIQAKLGTKWALEEILKYYYSGYAYVTEWFDYSGSPGEPNHFKIECEYSPNTAAETVRFLEIVNQVKRKSAILDEVRAVILGDARLHVRAVAQDWANVEARARRVS